MHPRLALRIGTLLTAALSALVIAGTLAGSAAASHTQVSIIDDDGQLATNPVATLTTLREIGAGEIRLSARWQKLAPKPNSFRRPAGFNASNPAAYPAASWSLLDTQIIDATKVGITVDLNVTGGAPLWATGPGMPSTKGCPCGNWAPQAAPFGAFVRAVATRYSGNYDPVTRKISPGNAADLPRVNHWSIWNEPNYGPSLAPQALPGHPNVEDAPRLDRLLIDSAWAGLKATGHGSDTILFGDIAPRGTLTFGVFNGMSALGFVRAMYCVGANDKPLRGTAANLRGCPTSAAGSARFAAQNPALFKASGFADHPYMRFYPPNDEENIDPVNPQFASLSPNWASLALIGQLEKALKRVIGVYGSKHAMPVWSTEFGYITSPPKRIWNGDKTPYPSQTVAASYLNWAEYISWKDPNIASYDQYLLEDGLPALQSNNYGSFASGLISYGGKPKPGLAAWRMPIYLPQINVSPGRRLEVWGDVRPTHFTQIDLAYDSESVNIMFEPTGGTQSTILDTVPIGNPQGYFDTKVRFGQSGTVWLSWTYPNDALLGDAGRTIVSRKVQVTVS